MNETWKKLLFWVPVGALGGAAVVHSYRRFREHGIRIKSIERALIAVRADVRLQSLETRVEYLNRRLELQQEDDDKQKFAIDQILQALEGTRTIEDLLKEDIPRMLSKERPGTRILTEQTSGARGG